MVYAKLNLHLRLDVAKCSQKRNSLLTVPKNGMFSIVMNIRYGADEGTWTPTKLPPLAPEASASADSATSAYPIFVAKRL